MSLSVAQGFTKSLAITVLSEIGDKTFFAAAILAMRYPRRHVLSGCLGALIVMTILSAVVGWAAPNLNADITCYSREAKESVKLATIGLAAEENPLGVVLGGILGQALCTTAAVLGGKSLANQISEKIVALSGAVEAEDLTFLRKIDEKLDASVVAAASARGAAVAAIVVAAAASAGAIAAAFAELVAVAAAFVGLVAAAFVGVVAAAAFVGVVAAAAFAGPVAAAAFAGLVAAAAFAGLVAAASAEVVAAAAAAAASVGVAAAAASVGVAAAAAAAASVGAVAAAAAAVASVGAVAAVVNAGAAVVAEDWVFEV
ncbi:hypothetical protein SASPL_110355 [Salvia splendens]|uniref:GDT1 family protein n=1 Tax=Salvia splendens TaxID=180675 RepID=A0A8X8Y731_SALSN|nr:hypothetical protein SASPL_110355 [Salvia splendens]